jgi:hypothetical protein
MGYMFLDKIPIFRPLFLFAVVPLQTLKRYNSKRKREKKKRNKGLKMRILSRNLQPI